MNELAIREHQFTITFLKKELVDTFKAELQTEIERINMGLKSFEYRRNQVLFTLSGTMKTIVQFIEGFSEQWNIREMGVSKFARVMEIDIKDADEWYREIAEYKDMIMSKSSFESKVLMKIMKCSDIDKLQYLKRHFMDQLDELIQLRIDTLLGNQGEYEAYLSRQIEKQELLNKLNENKGVMDDQTLLRVKSFIENS